MPSQPKRIAVLIPCYQEELTVAKVIADFQRVLPEAKIYVFAVKNARARGSSSRRCWSKSMLISL